MSEHSDLIIPELAARWRKSSKTIQRMIRARLLDNVKKIGCTYLIPLESVEAYEKRHTLPGRLKPTRRTAAAAHS